jgi:hypothetical protein
MADGGARQLAKRAQLWPVSARAGRRPSRRWLHEEVRTVPAVLVTAFDIRDDFDP